MGFSEVQALLTGFFHKKVDDLLAAAQSKSCCGLDLDTLLISPSALAAMGDGDWCIPPAYTEASVVDGLRSGKFAVTSVHPSAGDAKSEAPDDIKWPSIGESLSL